jgi:5-(carboxyamino)imidazole ribonucleotide synthase
MRSVGVVGGGQLAWMLAEAAAPLDLRLHVQTPRADDPAAGNAASTVLAAVDDVDATRELARRCGAISFENEWLPLDQLAPLEADGIEFVPALHSLRPLIDKRSQRQLLQDLHLPTPRWCPLQRVLVPPPSLAVPPADDATARPAQVDRAPAAPLPPRLPDGFSFPLMAKAGSGGYDGRGTRPIVDQASLEALLESVDPSAWILEEMVPFERELAITACRDRDGTVLCFPLVQTSQHRRVCDWVLYPAPVDHAVRSYARNIAASLLTSLQYVGVLTIELFYGPGGLMVNELAPRTHNSGHLTIEAFRHSQFEQQLRIVAGLPMGLIEPQWDGALMVNLLGFRPDEADYKTERRALQALPGAHLHWYGKRGAGVGRKLGHLTLELKGADNRERQIEAERRLDEVREIWPLPADN